jgi:trimethylamine--corrinoid protein Co-methyltransferase
MSKNLVSEDLAKLVHKKSIEILTEVGFCVPEDNVLARLDSAGFLVDHETQMVRITLELLDQSLRSLPKNVLLYNRNGDSLSKFRVESCFMGAGTPVNVFDLDSGEKRSSTRKDVQRLVIIQDALHQVDIVRPTVTATDQGESSDLVEIAELLLNTSKPIVHRVLFSEHVEAVVKMLFTVSGGKEAFQAKPNFATLYCPISPGYFTPENIHCMLKWAEHGVPITLLSMAMGGASAPVTLQGELIVINSDILAWIVVLQTL